MPSSRTSLASLPALPAGAAALLFEHGVLYVLAALLLCPVLACLPVLADIAARWRADQPRRERERIGNQALTQIRQADPERALELLARLPPLSNPFEREESTAEGPAPPEPITPPCDPAAGRPAGTF